MISNQCLIFLFISQAKLLDLEQLEQCEISLSCAGQILEDGVLAKELEQTTLDLNVPLLGGNFLFSIFFIYFLTY